MIHSRARTMRTQKMLGAGARELFADGAPPCVVAFHGFGGTAAELVPVLEHVARAGFAVDAALMPGHGTRVEALQDETFDTWLDAGRARVRGAAVRYGRFVLLGFSLGSLIALELAAERPQGLVGLVVLGNAVTLSSSLRVWLRLMSRLGRAVPDVYVLKPRAGDLADPAALGALVTYDRNPLRAAVEVYRAGARVRAVVGRVVCPTLILHGRLDSVCPWQNAVWLARHIGAADVAVRIFDRSAHVLARDGERDEVGREVASFVARSLTCSRSTRTPPGRAR